MAGVSSLSRKILRELCMNSRVTVTELSKNLGVSRPIITKHIQSLEREFGLKYTIDLNYRELGLGGMTVYYISFAKKPPESVIELWLKKSNMIQLALKTRGDFDLVIFVLASNDEEFAKWNLNIGLDFSDYGISVNKSDMDIIHHGFVPFSEKIIETTKVDDIYKRLLIELNNNSRANVRELAKKLKVHEEMLRYYLSKLVKMNVIRRFTTIITKLEHCTNVMFFVKYTYRPGAIERIHEKRKIYFKKESEIPLYNEWQMVSSISGSGDEFEWAIAENQKQAIDERVKIHERLFKQDSPVVKLGIVENTLKGVLAIRNVNIKEVYRKTEWLPGQNYTGD